MITAWLGSEAVKARTLEALREDQRLDRFMQRQYWLAGRGCWLGCLTRTIERDNQHAAAWRMFGIPAPVRYWLEAVFEGLPADECAQWVIDSAQSIPASADLTLARHRLCEWLLGPDSPSAEGNRHASAAHAVAEMRELHRRAAAGELVPPAAWASAAEAAWWSAAESAPESAAEAAAEAAAESAAWPAAWPAESAEAAAWPARSAARSAESAARSAARSAAESAWSAAESAAWRSIADKSLEIFAACPVTRCDPCEDQIRATMADLEARFLVRVEGQP